MFDRLRKIEEKYNELSRILANPEIFSKRNEYTEYTKTHAELAEIVDKFNEYKKVLSQINDVKHLILLEVKDRDFLELAEVELNSLNEKKEKLETELKIMLLPRDPLDSKNIFLEIRAGAGGDEASLFASVLFRIYSKYAEKQSWKVELIDSHPTGIGGFKEIIAFIGGEGVYKKLKYEKGVHRVQRIPVTESGGRIHTSTVTVAVLPEAEEVEIEIDPKDLRVDVFRSSGPGGQSVNTTDSAVRITHIPTGLVVQCQDERSQLKNKNKAMRVLRARLLDIKEEEQKNQISSERRSQVGTGERSERIRTYNFPQGRVTDHRIGLTLHKLNMIMEGDMDELIDALIASEQAERLARISG